MDRVRIGLIGTGVIGAAHSTVLQHIGQALPGRLELVAAADPSDRARQMFGSVYGYRQLFDNGHRLIADADIDAVFVCTPTVYHAELVDAAAKRGLPIFCEKPLSMNWAEGRRMVDAVERAAVPSQIGLVLRFSAAYTVMRDLVRDSRAGAPISVVFRDDQVFPIRGVHDSAWRADRTQSAGGTLIEHGVHDLDILTWFFGPVQRLRAWEQNRAGHPGIEDYMAVELEFEGGLRAQLVNVWHSMIQRPSNRRLEIFCENAFIAAEGDFNCDIICQYGDGPEEIISSTEVLKRFLQQHPTAPESLRDMYGVSYLVQDLAFVEALLSARKPEPSIQVGLEAQRLAAATYHAARTGTEVEVPSFRPASD